MQISRPIVVDPTKIGRRPGGPHAEGATFRQHVDEPDPRASGVLLRPHVLQISPQRRTPRELTGIGDRGL